MEVRTYVYDTPATTQEFEIDNKVFAKGLKAVLETWEVDAAEELPIAKIHYKFSFRVQLMECFLLQFQQHLHYQ